MVTEDERAAAEERPGAEAWVPADGDVESLRASVPACRGCELWAPATQAVFSSGPSDARLVLVGEQPGDREDIEGEPFVGPAGRVLADALAAAGVDPEQVYVTNAVKHFRFEERGKRRLHKKPGITHIEACHPWLAAELAAVAPVVVVCLGATAARAVLGRTVRIGQERGSVLSAGGEREAVLTAGGGEPRRDDGAHRTRVVITAHPSSVLRLRGKDGWQEAFDALVDDLRVAAEAQNGG